MGNKLSTASWLLSTISKNKSRNNSTLVGEYCGTKLVCSNEHNLNQNSIAKIINEQHPHMKYGTAHMHGTSYNLNVSEYNSELVSCNNVKLVTKSFSQWGIGGQCVGTYFLSTGIVITICVFLDHVKLFALNPDTLDPIAEYRLPSKNRMLEALTLNFRNMTRDVTSGVYVYIDNQENIIIGCADTVIRKFIFAHQSFQLVAEVFLLCYLVNIVSVLPDFNGNLWVTDSLGDVVVYNIAENIVTKIKLDGTISNGIAVAADQIYILTNEKLYAYNNHTQYLWSAQYQKVNYIKPGLLSTGSGSTPTILPNYVVITDNSEEYIHANFYFRQTGILHYSINIPFNKGLGGNECSVVGISDTQVIVVNNYGYGSFDEIHTLGLRPIPGVCMVNISPEYQYCGYIQWVSHEVPSTSLPLVDSQLKYLYLYTMDPICRPPSFSVTIINIQTGTTLRKYRTGCGIAFDNHWSPLHLGPDGIYTGTINGIMKLMQCE